MRLYDGPAMASIAVLARCAVMVVILETLKLSKRGARGGIIGVWCLGDYLAATEV
jgi:hypothetical protein